MKFLIVDPYYPKFLQDFYTENHELHGQSYAKQYDKIMSEFFGAADDYSFNLKSLGHEAEEVIPNCYELQKQWAQEHGVSIPLDKSTILSKARNAVLRLQGKAPRSWFYDVLSAQIKHHRPDILYIQDMNWINGSFLQSMRPYVKRIFGQIACPLSPSVDLKNYDLVLSSFPHYVSDFRAQGVSSQYFKIGFEPRILNHLPKMDARDLTFVGGLSPHHRERIALLESIVTKTPLEIWGYNAEAFPEGDPIRNAHKGPAWALKMYGLFASSRISLNHHINVAGEFANNMRLYEATGVGSLLLTDAKQNLGDLFHIGQEIVSYDSPEDCVEKIQYLLAHETERASIAAAGQARTLKDHTYRQRMQELVEIASQSLAGNTTS